jgi:hypothetical protein
LTPNASVNLTASINIPGNATPGPYNFAVNTQDTTGAPSHTSLISLQVGDYSISGTQSLSGRPAGQVTANLKINSVFAYGGKITATCDASALAGAMCTLAPSNPITVPSGGSASLTVTLNLPNDATPGTYTIKITAQDSTSTLNRTASISLTIAQDFLVTTSTASQTVTAGQTSGPYALAVQPVGSSFTGAVSLACTAGLPSGAQCLFNPSTPVTPGNSAIDVVMNISTKSSSVHSHVMIHRPPLPPVIWLAFATIVLSLGAVRNRGPNRARLLLGCALFCITTFLLVSCAGVSRGGTGSGTPPPPATYQITVTGTSPGTPPDAGQSTTVTLIVN